MRSRRVAGVGSVLKPISQRMNPRVAVPVVYVAATFMNVMDVTIVNVAVPSIGRSFGDGAASLTAVSVSYLLSLAVVIPAAGWIGNRLGMKRVFLAAIAIFTVSSGFCSIAPSLELLVVARIFQGIGGGTMIPVGLAMLYRTFPAEERVWVASLIVVPTAFGPAIGPLVGGLLVTDLSWRWVFYVNLPVGLAALAFGSAFLVEQHEATEGSFDLFGFVLAGVGFSTLMFGVTSGSSRGWGSPLIVATLLAGAALIAVMLRVERRAAHPILALRLYRDRLFMSGSAAYIAGVSTLFGLLFIVPLFLQIGLGHSALQSGIDTCPEAFGVMVGSQLTSRVLYARVGPRRLSVAGLLGVAASAGFLILVTGHSDVWLLRALMFTLGVSMGPVYVAAQAAAFATVSRADMGQASSLFNSQRQLGTAVGVAMLSTVLSLAGGATRAVHDRAGDLTGYHLAFAAAAVLGLAGAVVALGISDRDAAATMVRRPRKTDRAEDPAPAGSLAPTVVQPAGGP